MAALGSAAPVIVELLRIDGLRSLDGVELLLGPGFNLLVGGNGAGKSSIVEALHLCGHGRSFRSPSPDALIGHDAGRFSVFARFKDGHGHLRQLGLGREPGTWVLRLDGATAQSLSECLQSFTVVCIEPEACGLVSGSGEGRRRFLDWMLFHVEPDFIGVARRYQRALRQRNAALRSGLGDAQLDIWEQEMSLAGESIDGWRRGILTALEAPMMQALQMLVPMLDASALGYRGGWPAEMSLAEALREGRASDRERGFSQRGPHRGDWRLRLPGRLEQQDLSRGQAKLASICAHLAQAQVLRDQLGSWPLFACDDLGSELDAEHLGRVLEWLAGTGAQVVLTATHLDERWQAWQSHAGAVFHVEQGRVRPLL
ncbi:MAG: DNA replication/repair protein RecF [Xanthomonadales bacterium]|nr:DNA replication/repair protein RecF [Xanthomonadales bacterium]